MRTAPVESFEDAAQRFPGIDQLDPRAIGKFVFFSAGNFPEDFYKAELEDEWDHPPRDEWQSEVARLLINVRQWREHAGETTRFELAKKAEEGVVLAKETAELLENLATADPDTGLDSVVSYLDRWGFEFDIDLAPSPMFPEGRRIKRPATTYINREKKQTWLPHNSQITRSGATRDDTHYLNDEIQEYLEKGHSISRVRTRINDALGKMETVDSEEQRKLREKYGAKAANLLAFQEVLNKLYEITGEDGITRIEIPPFVPVDIDMFKAWLGEDSSYEEVLEKARQAAVELTNNSTGGLVAVRSSAVYTEDGENHTGAGVYESVVVDPSDPKAFAEGVQAVYQSVTSPDALAYQESCGVEAERMGLLLQAYEEKAREHNPQTYGFINSRGANPKLIEAHTSEGILLFDKDRLLEDLLLERMWSDEGKYLHLTPDHSRDLRMVPHQIMEAVHATVLAELVFQSPVQIEYVAGNKVVQVRPLPSKAFETNETSIVFPENLQEVGRTKALGVGDLTLKELNTHDNNEENEGFVVFGTEYGFTNSFIRTHAGSRALPEKGAVIILSHSDSGHIQTLCQERGLLCFYPSSKNDDLEGLERYIDEYTVRGYDKPSQKLRFVADGYDGRIYRAD